jgi:hypothetical protein
VRERALSKPKEGRGEEGKRGRGEDGGGGGGTRLVLKMRNFVFLKVEGDAMTSLCQSLSNINAKRQGVRRTGGRKGEKGGQGGKGGTGGEGERGGRGSGCLYVCRSCISLDEDEGPRLLKRENINSRSGLEEPAAVMSHFQQSETGYDEDDDRGSCGLAITCSRSSCCHFVSVPSPRGNSGAML